MYLTDIKSKMRVRKQTLLRSSDEWDKTIFDAGQGSKWTLKI